MPRKTIRSLTVVITTCMAKSESPTRRLSIDEFLNLYGAKHMPNDKFIKGLTNELLDRGIIFGLGKKSIIVSRDEIVT